MRLIDADKLRGLAIPCEFRLGALTDLGVPLYQIDNAPTVIWCSETSEGLPLMDLRTRPQSEWIEHYDSTDGFTWLTCSRCMFKAYEDDYNFCPNCGADMRGGRK